MNGLLNQNQQSDDSESDQSRRARESVGAIVVATAVVASKLFDLILVDADGGTLAAAFGGTLLVEEVGEAVGLDGLGTLLDHAGADVVAGLEQVNVSASHAVVRAFKLGGSIHAFVAVVLEELEALFTDLDERVFGVGDVTHSNGTEKNAFVGNGRQFAKVIAPVVWARVALSRSQAESRKQDNQESKELHLSSVWREENR